MNIHIYDKFAEIRNMAFEDVAGTKPILKKWYDNLKADMDCLQEIDWVYDKGGWQDIPIARLQEMINSTDIIFVRLIKNLIKARVRYSVASLYRMWNRLKALDQIHILSYLRMCDLCQLHRDNTLITGDLIVTLCFSSKDALETFIAGWHDQKNVLLSLCVMMGCAQNADIKETFKRWCVTHHPDKGGDHELFVKVNAAYNELQGVML